MNLRILILLVFFSSLSAPALAAPAESLPRADFKALDNNGDAVVEQVIDPLTVRLDDKRIIKIVGIEIPDWNDYQPGPLSITAIGILKDMLEGKSVKVYQTKRDDWGRANRIGQQLAHLARKKDEAWVQGTLVSLGLARVLTDARNPEMTEEMYALEDGARQEKMGLWANDAYKILKPEDASRATGKTAIIEGRARSVAMREGNIYVNFGENWKTDFTLIISQENRREFFKRDIDPIKWQDKLVRARGWVGERNGPYIEIDHPEQVEFPPDPRFAKPPILHPEPPRPMLNSLELKN